MKERIQKMIAVVCAVLMTLPFIRLVYAEDTPVTTADIIESCTLYKEARTNVYYFYMKLFPDWTLSNPSDFQCEDLKLRLSDSQGKPYFADAYALNETFFDVTHTFILRYAAANDQDPQLLMQSEVLFPQGYFVNSEMRQSDALTFKADPAMNADRVCYCPYHVYTELSTTVVNKKMNCASDVWIPVGTEPELRFEIEDEQAHKMHARLDHETGDLTILRRGETITVILYADGEPVDKCAYCIDRTYDDVKSFLLGTLEAFGHGIVGGAEGMIGSFRALLIFILAPFAVVFNAIRGISAELFYKIKQV